MAKRRVPNWTEDMAKIPCILDCSWWRYQMETFSALLAICEGIHRSPAGSPHKGQWRGAMIFLSAAEQTVQQTIETPLISDAIVLTMTSLKCIGLTNSM